MVTLLVMLLPFIGILLYVWRLPIPINMKLGMAMIGWSIAMLFVVGIWYFCKRIADVYKEVQVASKSNCLVWRHPDHNGSTALELVYFAAKTDLEKKSTEYQKTLAGFRRYFHNPASLKQAIKDIDVLIKQKPWEAMAGADWYYKYYWFMPEKSLKWLYEEKQTDNSYKLKQYNPDAEITNMQVLLADNKGKISHMPTSGELASALDWRAAKRRLMKKKSFADHLATGAVIAMPAICVLAIMFLLDMLNKKGG